MATRQARRIEALQRHVEFCRERTRRIENRRIAALEVAYAAQQAAAREAEEQAQQARAGFTVIGGGAPARRHHGLRPGS